MELKYIVCQNVDAGWARVNTVMGSVIGRISFKQLKECQHLKMASGAWNTGIGLDFT
jgi:hypothetical protein